MDELKWFKIEVIYPLNNALGGNEEPDEIDLIRMRSEGLVDDYEIDIAIFNLSNNTISQLNPKCFVPRGKTNKKYYTEIVFENGDFVFALGKPEHVYSKVNEYLLTLPTSKKED
jgi:hypothetical protein